jgi:Family of unknown function (DUF5681)/Histidine kinase-, DNA gyrase B-, and HSP90-like ATPase
VGYGKPPRHTRFKKGQSGNLKGRPKGSQNLTTLLSEALNERVIVTENGGRRRITMRQAINQAAPFYTTKEPGKGSGLGLAQVYGLARQSGGGLRIKSAVGQGTTVEVYLPRSLVQGAAVTGGWDSEPPRAFGGRATVLVVDDQEDVREVTVAHLEALGIKSFRPPVVAPRSTFWGATALVSSW